MAAQPVTVSPALPNSAAVVLAAGTTVNASVRLTNTGVVPMTYFADARLRTTGTYELASQVPGDDLSAVDLPESLVLGTWLVPTRSTSVTFRADATLPVQLDAGWFYGDPEVFGDGLGNTATATATARQLAPGPWYSSAGVIGPFSGAAPEGTVAYTATVTTRLFDPAVTSSTGDFWTSALTPAPAGDAAPDLAAPLSVGSHWRSAAERSAERSAVVRSAAEEIGPLTLAPGETGTITVAITPPASATGTVTRGTLFIDTFDFWTGTGDEVAGIPYAYTVK